MGWLREARVCWLTFGLKRRSKPARKISSTGRPIGSGSGPMYFSRDFGSLGWFSGSSGACRHSTSSNFRRRIRSSNSVRLFLCEGLCESGVVRSALKLSF